jgi:hypothetical protein
MPRGFRAHGMDQAEVWGSCWPISQLVHVSTILCPTYFLDFPADGISLITIFLYMVAELSALQQIVNALTGLNGLPAVIVQCTVTTIYTCMCHLIPLPVSQLLTCFSPWWL